MFDKKVFIFTIFCLSFVIAQIVNSISDLLNWLISILHIPFSFIVSIEVHDDTFALVKWLIVLFYLFVYGGIINLLLQLWHYAYPHKNFSSVSALSSLCESELSELINLIDQKAPNEKIRDSTIKLLREFERGVKDLFSLKKGDYKCLWAFPTNLDGDENICIIAIENEVTKEEAEIFAWALGSNKHTFYSNDIKDNFNGTVREIAFARNLGVFRLGFAITIHKEGIVTRENRDYFKAASSYLLLLGHIDKLTQEMVYLHKELMV